MSVPIKNHRTLFENAPDGILVVDASGIIRDVNAEAERLFDYSRQELEGQSIEVLVPEAAREAHSGHRARYQREPLRRPMGIGMELLARRKDGSTFPAEISLNRMPGEEGDFTVATVRDVSMRKRLRDFGAGALRASEEVRARIARDLHDDTAQQLSAHLIRLRLLEKASSPGERKEHLKALRAGIQATAEGVRRIARGLRPPELQDAGLLPALQAHVRALEQTHELRVSLDVESVERYLTPDGLLVLYRIVQEALTNVARHAGTGEASVTVGETGEFVVAEITDQGQGFRPDRTYTEGRGLGLIGMQERAVMVGGHLRVDSGEGEGTRVLVRLPKELSGEVQRV
ncbi:MAG: PAS domain S-box protein [Gemmatimonadales bacterium]|nr:MAG: PAS domain S-box protein [Gemmatimonadales bacterium]